MADKQYVVKADTFPQVVSKPTEPLRVREHVKGDKVTLDETRGNQLVAAGALVDPATARKSEAAAKKQAEAREAAEKEAAERAEAERKLEADRREAEEAEAKAQADAAARDAQQ